MTSEPSGRLYSLVTEHLHRVGAGLVAIVVVLVAAAGLVVLVTAVDVFAGGPIPGGLLMLYVFAWLTVTSGLWYLSSPAIRRSWWGGLRSAGAAAALVGLAAAPVLAIILAPAAVANMVLRELAHALDRAPPGRFWPEPVRKLKETALEAPVRLGRDGLQFAATCAAAGIWFLFVRWDTATRLVATVAAITAAWALEPGESTRLGEGMRGLRCSRTGQFLTDDERLGLELVASTRGESVLAVKTTPLGTLEVTTGWYAMPLAGSGHIVRVERGDEGEWTITGETGWTS